MTADEVKQKVDRARLLFDMGRPKEALPLLHQALAQNPEDASLLCQIAYIHYMQGAWETALVYAGQAVGADPREEWAHRLRSAALRMLHRPHEALIAAEEAVRLDPGCAYPLITLGNAQIDCGLLAEAEQTAESLRGIAPEEASTYNLLAAVCEKRKRWGEMERNARRGLECDPINTYAHVNLGRALANQKRKQEALDCWSALLELEPMNREARLYLRDRFSLFPCFFTPLLTYMIGVGCWKLGMEVGGACLVGLFAPMVLAGLVLRWAPQLYLIPQPQYRRLPQGQRDFIAAEWSRIWGLCTVQVSGCILLSPVFALTGVTLFYFLAFLVRHTFLHRG